MTLAFNMFFFPWVAATASNPVGWEVPPPDLVPPKRVYSPTRLPLAIPYFPGSVSWAVAPPDLPRSSGYRAAALMPISVGIEAPAATQAAVNYALDQLPQPPRLSGYRAAATIAGDPGIVAPKPLSLYQDTQSWPQLPAFQQRINRAAVLPALALALGDRVGLEWGFQEADSVPSLLPVRRHAYAELPRLDTPQLTLSGIDWVSGTPPRAIAKRDPADPSQYGPFGPRVALQWGFQEYEAVPTLTPARRHPYAELPRFDAPQLAAGGVDLVQGSAPSARPKRHPLDLVSVDFPQLASPFNWQPISEPPVRLPYRSAALHRDFGIEAAFNEPRLSGWASDPPILARPRYRLNDPGWSGDLNVAALATAALEWGFEVVAVVPSRHPFFRAVAGFPYWFGDVGEYVPSTPAGLTAWVPDNEIQILRPRSGGFRQILIMGGEVSGIFFPSPATPGGQIPQSGFFSNFGRLMNRGTR